MAAFAPPALPGTSISRSGATAQRSVLRRTRRSRPSPCPPSSRRPLVCRALHNAPTPSPPPTQSGRTPDYHANVGSVIDQLRDFYPRLLSAEPDLTHYSPAVVFADSTGYRVAGHDAYRAAFWMLRAQARFFFASSAVSITSLYYDDAAGAIYLRWRLQASPRGWALLAGPAMRARSAVVLDGLSVYTLDYRGYVAVHQLENNARRRSGLRHTFEDILSVGTVRIPGTPVGAGVGSGSNVPAGVPPWFRSIYELSELVSLTGDQDVEWERSQVDMGLGCCFYGMDADVVSETADDDDDNDDCESIFMEPVLSA